MARENMTSFDVHALNKALVCFELQREWRELSRIQSLSGLGYPYDERPQANTHPRPSLKSQTSRISMLFSFLGSSTNSSTLQPVQRTESPVESKPTDSRISGSGGQINKLPLFRLLLQRVWGAFPGLINLPVQTWLGIESLILGFNSRNFSTSRERRQFTKRAVISIGLTKLLSSYITSIIKFDNLDSLPTRPSEEDIGLISQLPELITLFGRRIKLIQRNSDQYLVIYRKSAKSPKLPIDDDLRKESSLGVKTSLISWMVLSNFLKTIDSINDHQPTNASIITIQKIFNDRSSHSEQLYQILEAFRLDPSSLDDEARQDLKSFLVEERLFREDWVHHGNRVSKAKKGYKNFLHKAVHDAGEVDKLYKVVGQHKQLEAVIALDPTYESAQTWSILWIAYLLHFIFIAGPNANEICELLIKIDKLLPYELIKQGLKIINPTLAIKTTVALILGQPFGSLSLFQRILDNILRHEIRTFSHQIQSILQPPSSNSQSAISNRLFQAIQKYVYLPGEEKRQLRATFDNSEEDIVILILRWSQDFDELEMKKVEEAQHLFQDSQHPAPNNIFHDLIVLLRLASLKADREQLLEMILEPNNPIISTIKQILEVYYPTIYKVALSSDLSQKFGQTEAFLKDLVRLLVMREEEAVTVNKIAKLLDSHKQSYWSFVNELVKYENLCHPIKRWIQSCFDLVTLGLRSPVSTPMDRFGVSLDRISTQSSIETILEESRSLSAYDRFIKMVDNIQYRLAFSMGSFAKETDFLSQAFEILGQLEQTDFAQHIAKSGMDARPPLPFGWAWWIDERKLCGLGARKLDDNLSRGAQTLGPNEHLVSGLLTVNSDLKEVRKLSQVYSDELMKSAHLFVRPSSSPSPPTPSTPSINGRSEESY